jgi:hypothetical protein
MNRKLCQISASTCPQSLSSGSLPKARVHFLTEKTRKLPLTVQKSHNASSQIFLEAIASVRGGDWQVRLSLTGSNEPKKLNTDFYQLSAIHQNPSDSEVAKIIKENFSPDLSVLYVPFPHSNGDSQTSSSWRW